MGRATNEQVIEHLRQLKRDLSGRMDIRHLILFGSRARGEELLTSDVDLIVVSDGFRAKSFRHRPAEVLELWPDVVDLEVLCYTEEEFELMKERLGIVQRAVKEGIEI